MIRALEHITITTGGARMSARSEVDDQVLQAVAAAISGNGQIAGWSLEVERNLGTARFVLMHGGLMIVRCWLCTDIAASSDLWTEASDTSIDERAVSHPPRGVPWLAVSLTAEALHCSGAVLGQAGDLERVVAWALIEETGL